MTSCFSRAICAERNHLMNLVSVRTRLTVCKMPVKDSSSILTMFNMLSGQTHNQQTGMPTFFSVVDKTDPTSCAPSCTIDPRRTIETRCETFLGFASMKRLFLAFTKVRNPLFPAPLWLVKGMLRRTLFILRLVFSALFGSSSRPRQRDFIKDPHHIAITQGKIFIPKTKAKVESGMEKDFKRNLQAIR
jgi:hypothetical protein